MTENIIVFLIVALIVTYIIGASIYDNKKSNKKPLNKTRMKLHVNEMKLEGNEKFHQQFNLCSDLFAKAMNESLSDEERKLAWKEYHEEKLKLEQGLY